MIEIVSAHIPAKEISTNNSERNIAEPTSSNFANNLIKLSRNKNNYTSKEEARNDIPIKLINEEDAVMPLDDIILFSLVNNSSLNEPTQQVTTEFNDIFVGSKDAQSNTDLQVNTTSEVINTTDGNVIVLNQLRNETTVLATNDKNNNLIVNNKHNSKSLTLDGESKSSNDTRPKEDPDTKNNNTSERFKSLQVKELEIKNHQSEDARKIIEVESNRLGLTKPKPEVKNQKEELPIKNDENILQNVNNRTSSIEPREVIFKNPIKNTSDTKEIIQQIVQKTQLLVKQNSSEMQIQLKPEFLGKMLIKITVDEGIITARFITENNQVKQLLEANMNTLRQSLEANGLKVERTEVNVQINNGSNFLNQQTNQQSMWQGENKKFPYSEEKEDYGAEEVLFNNNEQINNYDYYDQIISNKQVNYVV